MKYATLVVLLVSAAGWGQTPPVCTSAQIRWSQVGQKMKNSSLNSAYFYTFGNEGLSRAVQGLSDYVIELGSQAEWEINSLCSAIDKQEQEIEQLQAEVAELKKTGKVSRAGASGARQSR